MLLCGPRDGSMWKRRNFLVAGRAATGGRCLPRSTIAGIAACPDPETRAVLERLCSLYALTSLHQDRAWFLEHSRLSPGRARAMGNGDGDNISIAILKLVEVPPA